MPACPRSRSSARSTTPPASPASALPSIARSRAWSSAVRAAERSRRSQAQLSQDDRQGPCWCQHRGGKQHVRHNAQLVAEDIASQLERRIAFRRAMKMAMRNAMSPRRGSGAVAAKGIKIQVGGRLDGADIARSEQLSRGHHSPADAARGHRLRLCRGGHHLRQDRRQGLDL